ncbi:MAG: hypothetical protein H6686_04090 [Fibrobacteria bacterium]|nr:hypothetical protein [Fibrobacteria bacterium]
MRAPFQTSLPRLAVLASILASTAGLASAYDEETIGDHLQPFIGGWVGMYQVDTKDLEYMVARSMGQKSPRLDVFLPVVPAGGVTMGVAYGRLHLGANLGYQLRDGGDFSAAKQAQYGIHPSFRYEVVPLDFSLDLAMLPNEYPINFLIGGSGGIGFTRIQNPFPALVVREMGEDGTITSTKVYPKDNVWETNNFALATGYVGARINLLQRLNLEGQIGYRLLRTDAVQSDEGPDPYQISHFNVDSAGNSTASLKPIPIDLSGAYLRVDLRWTFASKAQKERQAALERRRKQLQSMVAGLDRR